MEIHSIGSAASAPPPGGDRAAAVKETAIQFEAVFLAEMLKHAGLGVTRKAHGGGAGEDAFASFLTMEYATRMARHGGVGLSAAIEAQLLRADGFRD